MTACLFFSRYIQARLLNFPEARWRGAAPASCATGAASGATSGTGSGASGGAASGCDVDDLIHLRGPLTEDAVVRALQARFYNNKFYVSRSVLAYRKDVNCLKAKVITLQGRFAHLIL